MAETPQQDPMQAVAFARITATELGQDAREQAEACQQGLATLTMLVDALAHLAELIPPPAGGALMTIVAGTRAVGVGLQHVGERFAAHAEGWEREQKVWQAIMDGAAPAPVVEKAP
jgi:hypothetical protein